MGVPPNHPFSWKFPLQTTRCDLHDFGNIHIIIPSVDEIPNDIDKYWMKHIPQVPSDLILPSSPPIGSSARHPSPVSGAVPAAGWGPPAPSWGRRVLLGGEEKWDEKKGWSRGKIWNNLEETRIIWKNLEKIWKNLEKIGKIMGNETNLQISWINWKNSR
jgi:hypothetical protein